MPTPTPEERRAVLRDAIETARSTRAAARWRSARDTGSSIEHLRGELDDLDRVLQHVLAAAEPFADLDLDVPQPDRRR
ncbi:hypothetical protein [Embleya hyalina]|uniref:Uncharacterized protein n=1 Tax=Embleya hyalina TaxID=516124 RepID=A0A401Z428_9ACTN|nr:hypothetical protein [Embleya hyalina]GCE01597.1 hypothetical protein EHYA_09363 [Embleya hyalina]